MGNRAFASRWLLAVTVLLLVGLQHAVITALPLRGPAGKTLKLTPGKVLERVARALVPASGAVELDGYKKDENDDNEKSAPTATSRTAEMGGMLVAMAFFIVAEVVHYPLDTIKTRLQAGNSDKLFKGVYAGMWPALTLTACSFIYAQTPVLESYLSLPHAARAPLVILLAVVRWLKIAGFLVWVPFEVVTRRLQAGVDKTWLGAVSSIVASKGLTGFYVGWVPALALRLLSTEIRERTLVAVLQNPWFRRKDDKEREEPEKARNTESLCVLLVFAIATGLTTPLDVVKTRLMTQSGAGQYKGWLDCLQTVTKDEGPAALFRGAGLRIFGIVLRVTGFVVAFVSILITAIAVVLPGVLACGYFLSGVIQVMVQQEAQRAAARE